MDNSRRTTSRDAGRCLGPVLWPVPWAVRRLLPVLVFEPLDRGLILLEVGKGGSTVATCGTRRRRFIQYGIAETASIVQVIRGGRLSFVLVGERVSIIRRVGRQGTESRLTR